MASRNNPYISSRSPMGRFKAWLLGSPLATDQLAHEKIPKWKALAVLSSDALSSVAYATEEVLIPLAAFSVAAVSWSLPIAIGIGLLLLVITLSYRQTIDSYPNGGGAYTVAKENLGTLPGLVAAAALLIDYVLTVSVSTAAGVENIASAFPQLLAHKEMIGIILILVITVFNLRGVRESATVFALPTYFFIGSFLLMIVVGAYRLLMGEVPQVAPIASETFPELPLFLVLRAFASGCSALTGVEAISNGIPIFKDPAQKNAKTTMAWMSAILGGLFLSITILAHAYGVNPKEGETAVSLLASAIFGKSVFYYIVQGSTALILLLAANTSYADFPRLSSLLARDRFLPRQFASLGDRLVFSNGIIGLSVAAIFLLVIFEGDTHHLIPLYAVGVFLSFTLSQFGMVWHHYRTRHAGWQHSIVFNLIGGLATGVVLIVIASTKFIAGAWMVILLIPLFVWIFHQIRVHYVMTARQLQIAAHHYDSSLKRSESLAIIPVSGIHPGVVDAIHYARSISTNVVACTVGINQFLTDKLKKEWEHSAPDVELVVLESPFRSVIRPVVDYVDALHNGNKAITVIIPEFVTRKWYHSFLHNQTALLLYAALRGKKGLVVTSVRYHL